MDSFTAALRRLDPANRALLDLSLRRGMRPEEIGSLLGLDPQSVVVAREGALEQLADELGMEARSEFDALRARLAELPADAWTPQLTGRAEPAARTERGARTERAEPAARTEPAAAVGAAAGRAAAAAGPEPDARASAPRPAPAPEPEPERRNRLPLLLTLLAVCGIALVVALVAGGGDDTATTARTTSTPTSATTTPTAKPKPKPKPPPRKAPPGTETEPGTHQPTTVRLTRIARTRATGTARLTQGGKRLVIEASGLPEGTYQVWLYNSLVKARSIGGAEGTKPHMDLHLPPSASHYRAIDVSREPRDGNPNHSGVSVLRVRLAKLAGG
jgi:hypothetical protein